MRYISNVFVIAGLLLVVGTGAALSGTVDSARFAIIINGNLEQVKVFLDRGAAPDVRACLNGMTPLMLAASFNRADILKVLLKSSAGINDTDDNGCTALIIAADKGNLESVKLLLDGGANINARDRLGRTVLIRVLDVSVAQFDRRHLAEKMKAGSELKGRFAVAQFLAANGADLTSRDNAGRTALAVAAGHGHIGPAKILAERGASVSSADNNGVTVLMAALSGGYAELVRYLIDKGADVNAADDTGTTALLMATERGNNEVVEALAGKGADVRASDIDGAGTLLKAIEGGNPEAAALLIKRGADLNTADNLDRTPLTAAVGKITATW